MQAKQEDCIDTNLSAHNLKSTYIHNTDRKMTSIKLLSSHI